MIEYSINQFNKPIDVDGNLIDTTGKHVLIDGDVALLFNSIEKKNSYLSARPKLWSKESYSDRVNEAHNALFRSLYQERNYLSIGEISLWVDDAEFGVEAKALRNWWNETCKEVANYLNDVTEETALPVEEFIETLPKI